MCGHALHDLHPAMIVEVIRRKMKTCSALGPKGLIVQSVKIHSSHTNEVENARCYMIVVNKVWQCLPTTHNRTVLWVQDTGARLEFTVCN